MSSSQEDSSQSEVVSEPFDQSQSQGSSQQRESNDGDGSTSSSSGSSTGSSSASSSSSSSSSSDSGDSDGSSKADGDASQSGGAADAFMGAGLDLHGGAAAMAALTAGMPEPSMVTGDDVTAGEERPGAEEPQSQAALQRQSTSSNPVKDQGGDQADVVRRKVEELFPYFGDGQSITTTDFLELLSDMAIAADEEEVNTIVVDPDLIGLQEAMEAAVRLSGQGANTDAAVVTAAINVVQLTPWEFVKLKLTCGADPGTLYKIKWSSLLPSPRQQLIGATVVALLLCCACVALSIGLLWRGHRLSPERRMSEAALTFVTNAADGVGESAKMRTNATLQDAITLQGALITSHYDGMIGGERARLQLRAGSARGGTVSVGRGTMLKRTQQLRNSLRAAVAVARTNENRTASSWLAPFHRDVAAAAIVSAIETGDATVVAISRDGQTIEVPSGYAGLLCGQVCQEVTSVCRGVAANNLQASRNASHASFSVRVGTTGGFLCASVRTDANATQVAVESASRLLASGALSGARPVAAFLDPSDSVFGASCSLVATGESCVAPSFSAGEDFYLAERVSGVALVASMAVSLRYDVTFAATASTVAMLNSRQLPEFDVPLPGWEASLAVIDATGSVNPQATPPRDAAQCLGTCQRLRVATTVQADALSRPEGAVQASAAQHDYVPRPVLAVAMRLPVRGGVALALEAQLDSVANVSVRETVSIFDNTNTRIPPWELAAATRDSVPSVGFFDRRSPCTAELTCFEDPVAGVVYRSDCTECVGLDSAAYAAAIAADSRATLQTAFTPRVAALCAQGLCQGTREQVDLYVAALNGIPAEGILVDRSGEETFAFPHQVRVLASSALVGRSSLAVATLWPSDDYTSHGNDRLYIAVGLAPVVWFVLLLVQLMVARVVMEDIESEWAHYTTRMQEESQVFAAMVVDIFPIEVAERIMKGARRISDSSQLTFLFVNMCQFEAHYRSKLEPTVLCLFTSYYFMLLSHVAQQFRMYRVRTFGDTVFIAGGISDDRDSASFHAVCHRTLQAAAVIIELFSYQWTHTPAHVVCLRQVSSVDRAIVMPSVRIGVHCGNATLLVEPSTVGPPVFDVVGPSVGATVAVCNSAHTNTVNASEQVIEAARKSGEAFDSEFQFASATRRVSSHTGTVKTQLMRAANVAVPSRVVFAMGIRRATVRVYCGTEEKGGMTGSTHGSQQDLGSVVSGVSRQSKVFA